MKVKTKIELVSPYGRNLKYFVEDDDQKIRMLRRDIETFVTTLVVVSHCSRYESETKPFINAQELSRKLNIS